MPSTPDETVTPAAPGGPDDELARLRRENAELRSSLERERERGRFWRPRRRDLAAVMVVVLAAIAFSGATVGSWVRRSLLDTDVFAARVVPLARDPAVQAAISVRMTDEIMRLVNPQALFEEALPERGRILAGPLTNAVRGFVGDQASTFVASDAFERIWVQVVTRGHGRMVDILDGRSEVVSTRGDHLVINLVPVINQVLARIGEISPQLFGRTIDIPTLTADDVPEAARQRLGSALGVDLDPTFGVIEISSGGADRERGRELQDRPAPAGRHPDRERDQHDRRDHADPHEEVEVVVRRSALALWSEAVSMVPDPGNRRAADAVAGAFVEPMLDTTRLVLWLLALIALVAAVTGPYPWAVWVRANARRAASQGVVLAERGGAAVRSGSTGATVEWAAVHRGLLQAAGAVFAVLLLWVADLSWFGVLVVLALVGLYLAGVWWVTGGVAQGPRGPGVAAG